MEADEGAGQNSELTEDEKNHNHMTWLLYPTQDMNGKGTQTPMTALSTTQHKQKAKRTALS